jgi:hypothetical protein
MSIIDKLKSAKAAALDIITSPVRDTRDLSRDCDNPSRIDASSAVFAVTWKDVLPGVVASGLAAYHHASPTTVVTIGLSAAYGWDVLISTFNDLERPAGMPRLRAIKAEAKPS